MGKSLSVKEALRGLKESKLLQLPMELTGRIWDGKAVSGRKAVGAFKEKFNKCAICDFDEALDWHHLMVIDYKKPLMADGSRYEFCLGLIRLCPNHHALVHRNQGG